MFTILFSNLLAVTGATVVSFLIGWVWYSDAVYGKQWRQLVGMTDKKMKEAPMAFNMTLGVVTAFVVAWFINYLLSLANVTSFFDAILLSGAAFLGMTAASYAMNHAYALRPWKLYWIDMGYQALIVLTATMFAVLL